MRKILILNYLKYVFVFLIILQFTFEIFAQNTEGTQNEPDSMIIAARNMMKTSRYCSLITLDKTGFPSARTMDPFAPDENMIVWFGTNINSRKVEEISNDPKVALYYPAQNASGYVLIKGQAFVVTDTLKKQEYWKEEWSRFYPDRKKDYVLIEVIPEKLEILDYQHGITGDSKTWDVPSVIFEHIKLE